MSISDMIVVMKDGVVHQIDQPQKVYDDPVDLFVAKFLGTPPINVFEGEVRNGLLCIGENSVLQAPGAPDRKVWVGVRPEGFIPEQAGPLRCTLSGVEVMGRDVSVVASHPACSAVLRAIVSAESAVDAKAETVRFALKPNKVQLFDFASEERLRIELK